MADNAIYAHIFGRRRRGQREEAKLVLFNKDGTEFVPGQGGIGPEGPAGVAGPAGVPGGDTVQSMWTWRTIPVGAPMVRGEIGAIDPPPREATELITSCYDTDENNHEETLQALQAGDRIHLQVATNPESWHVYDVTGPAVDQGDATYSVPVVSSYGSPPDTAPIHRVDVLTAFQFSPRPGPQGPQGEPGLDGKDGEPGPQGPQGLQGPQGDQGLPGPMGTQGPTGPAGSGGEGEAVAGPQGPQGEPGPEGPQGTQGPQGVQGEKGDTGTQGESGLSGSDGAQGLQGDIGPRGFVGVQGPQGEQGIEGPEGPQGDIGPSGNQGEQGIEGPQGIQGPVGLQGPSGTGEAGDQGPPGPQGERGPEGPQGVSGSEGSAGAQGPKGDTGSIGPQGVSGPAGSAGVQGPKGDIGLPGIQGAQGAAGPGVATGGLTGHILAKKSDTDFDTQWGANTGGWTVVRKGADESVVNSNVIQDDNELQFTTLVGVAYEIELLGIYASPAAQPDIKCELSEDATARGATMWVGLGTSDAAQTLTTTDVGGVTAAFGTAAAKRVLRGLAHHVGGGGVLKFRWAQNTSNAQATTVYAGSVLRYRAIA